MGHGMRDTSAAAAAFRNRNGSILEAAAAVCTEPRGHFAASRKGERD